MPAFRYEAIDTLGQPYKGIIEGESERHARQLLRERQWIPLVVTITHAAQSAAHKNVHFHAWGPSIHLKELTLITRQLATLLAVGIPVEEALKTISLQTERDRTQSILMSIRSHVLEGHSLTTALQQFPQSFSNLYCATVAAGEKSGHLADVLNRLADHIEQQYQMRQRIQHALIYPCLMMLISTIIVMFLLTYVVPKMISVYQNTGQSLPTLTKILLSLSQFLQNNGIGLILCLLFASVIFRIATQRKTIRKKIHGILLRSPFVGKMICLLNTTRFSKTFGVLLATGVPLMDALQTATQLISNIPMKQAIENATQKIQEGASIHLALKQTPYFTPMSLHLIASGEASGQLEAMLARTADQQTLEFNRSIDTLLALFEPALTLLMGAVVLFIVLAILLPIFSLDLN